VSIILYVPHIHGNEAMGLLSTVTIVDAAHFRE
jgi:hypothetical protein